MLPNISINMNNFQKFCKNKEKIIGLSASILALVMFISLIEIFISNLKGESNIIIQPLATTINGFLWSLYGYGRKDSFIVIPNLSAFIIGFITMISALI